MATSSGTKSGGAKKFRRTKTSESYYSSHHQIACFKVTPKSYTAVAIRMKTDKDSSKRKRSKARLATISLAVRGRGVKSFRGLEACNLMTVIIG
jgi:hypothetical protein